jgi:hypothetical protein
VEVGDGWFFEGAWDGPFEEGDFTGATAVVGTGGRAIPGGVTFAAPTDLYQHLTSIRLGDRLWISNSLVFTFVLAVDRPDIGYPYYLFDILQATRWGRRKPETELRTHLNNRIIIHKLGNVTVTPDLGMTWHPGRLSPEPRDYRNHVDILETTLRRLFENGAHPGRRRQFSPLTTISGGYDSPAVSALAARAGCSQAVTISGGEVDDRDNGQEIAGYLGLEVTVIPRLGHLELPGTPEAEFCAAGGMLQCIMFSSLGESLAGRMFLLGRAGDAIWEDDNLYNFPDYFTPLNWNFGSATLNEIRLRLGFIHWSVLHHCYPHAPKLFEITSSAEMDPWHVPGNYDRPIPRRILETAGVPRESFGQKNMGSAYISVNSPLEMNRNSREDFELFCRSEDIPAWFPAGLIRRPLDLFFIFLDAIFFITTRLPGKRKRLFKLLAPMLLLSDRRRFDWRYKLKHLYLFHWGFDRIKDRYGFTMDDPGDGGDR